MKPTAEQMSRWYYNATVYQHQDFVGDWAKWKMRGRFLISPHGERITAQVLDRVLYREAAIARAQREPATFPESLDAVSSGWGDKVVPLRPRVAPVGSAVADPMVAIFVPQSVARLLRGALQDLSPLGHWSTPEDLYPRMKPGV